MGGGGEGRSVYSTCIHTDIIHTHQLVDIESQHQLFTQCTDIENKQCICTCTHHNIKDVDVNILKLWDAWQGKKRERADGRRERGRKGEREREKEGGRERGRAGKEGGREGGREGGERRKERRREVGR